MSFPIVKSLTTQRFGNGFTSGGTTHVITLPTYAVGDLVILFYASRQDDSSLPAGWTVMSNSAYNWHVALYKVMDGSEGASVTITTASASNASVIKYVIENYVGVPEWAASATGNPPELTVSWGIKDTLWIAAANNVGGSSRNISGPPADYTDFINEFASNSFTVDAVVGSARRELAVETEDPGAFSAVTADKSITIAVQGVVDPSESLDTDVFTVSFDSERTRTVTTDIEYAVKPSDSIAKNLTYTLDVDVVEQLNTQYTVVTEHSLDLEQVYKIIPTTIEELAIDYAVEYGTALTKSITYKIVDTNELTKSILYSISDDVALQLSLHYELETSSQVNVGIHYELISGEMIAKSLTYKLLDEKLTQREITYEVLTADSLSLTSQYNILSESLIPMTIEYELLDSTSFIKTLRYSVVSPEKLMFAQKYSILGTFTEQLSLEYGVVPPPVAIPLTLAYKVVAPQTPVEVTITYALIPYPYSKFCDNPYSKKTSPFAPATLPYSATSSPYTTKTTPYKDIPAVEREC